MMLHMIVTCEEKVRRNRVSQYDEINSTMRFYSIEMRICKSTVLTPLIRWRFAMQARPMERWYDAIRTITGHDHSDIGHCDGICIRCLVKQYLIQWKYIIYTIIFGNIDRRNKEYKGVRPEKNTNEHRNPVRRYESIYLFGRTVRFNFFQIGVQSTEVTENINCYHITK